MRWSKWAAPLLVVIIGFLPVVSFADSTDDEATAGTTGGTTTTTTTTTSGSSTGVDFDIGDNVFGDPTGTGKVSPGTLESITFLSGGSDPVSIVINIINLSLSFLGLLSLLMILYAGVTWFMAGDNEEEITKAKDIIKGAVIGLVITMSAMGIAQLVFNNTLSQTGTGSDPEDEYYLGLLDSLFLVTPALAAEEAAPEPEVLPFDPAYGALSTNTASTYVGFMSILDLGSTDPITIVYAVVSGLLTLLAFVFMILLLYAGVIWVLARGNEEQITKAKTILKRAVIGLIIVLSAYGIINVLTILIYEQTGGQLWKN